MNLKSRLDRVEKRLPKPEIKIIVTKGERLCPTQSEKERIRAKNPDKKFIYICNCPNCNPEDFKEGGN